MPQTLKEKDNFYAFFYFGQKTVQLNFRNFALCTKKHFFNRNSNIYKKAKYPFSPALAG